MFPRTIFAISLLIGLVIACARGSDASGPSPNPASATLFTSVSTPGPSPIPAPVGMTTDSSSSGPVMLPETVSLSVAEFQGLVHLGVKAAIGDLLDKKGGDLSLIQIERAEQVTWSDGSLGCPEPGMLYVQVLTLGVWLILSHEGQVFDYRISGSNARLCEQSERRDPLDHEPIVGLWSTLSPLPTARSEVAAAELNGRLYVFGGFGIRAVANEEYDPVADIWQKRAPIPQGVNHAAVVGLEGKLYLIGGFDREFQPLDTVWEYTPLSNTWAQKADLPTPRGALGVAVVNGKIYAVGGVGTQGDMRTNEEYDPATDTWRSRSPMPTPRDHVAISVVDGRIYVIGGRLRSFAINLVKNEVYDPSTNRWEEKSPLPSRRSGIAGATVNGKVYVFGGEGVNGTFDENERYNPITDSWQAMPPMPTARHGLGAAALGSRIYVLAGGLTPGGSRSTLNEVFISLPTEER